LSNQIDGFGGGGMMQIDLNRDAFMGHEFSAEVLESGPDTDAPKPGTLVTSLPVLVSATGVEPIIYSNKMIGGYAERMLLSLLTPIPNGLDPGYAALTEPMAVGLHAVNKSAIQPGETALVLGCGPIGIAIIAGLRRRGVETIVAADYSVRRRDLAEKMGAPLRPSTPPTGRRSTALRRLLSSRRSACRGSSTTSCAARGSAHASSLRACVCKPTPSTPTSPSPSRSTCSFVLAYDPTEFADCLRAIAEGDIDVAPMITGEVGLDGVGDAFDDLAHPDVHCKILVTP
jgi:threonine dehydrogenase-like Zn-dependent dehydrogenase